jgi:hypothetical protein
MPFTKKNLNSAKKLVKRIPAPLRRKAGTKLLKKAVGKSRAKKVVRAGRAARRATGMKFI